MKEINLDLKGMTRNIYMKQWRSETCKKGNTSEKFGTPKSGGTGFELETLGFGVQDDNHRTITPKVRSWPWRFIVKIGGSELARQSSELVRLEPEAQSLWIGAWYVTDRPYRLR